jgi:predicted metalloprotease
MRWTPGDRSPNIEDRRGMTVGRGMGIGGTVVALLLSLIFGRDFLTPSTQTDNGEVATPNGQLQTTPQEEKLVDFVSFVLDSAQATWARLLPEQGVRYHDAKLVLFRDATESSCGFAESATGPFYCPDDEKVYVDLGFFNELSQRFGASGDFAQAYVLAHELGHHVQKLLGIEGQVRSAMERSGGTANRLSVALELQADCFAGVWGYTAKQENLLDPGDAEEGLRAAAAVGDDRLQRMATGHVSPETFTHGSSAQRASWFQRGFTTGRLDNCDTFNSR